MVPRGREEPGGRREDILGRLSQFNGIFKESLSQAIRETRGRRDFNDLLVPPLYTAVALEEMDEVSLNRIVEIRWWYR